MDRVKEDPCKDNKCREGRCVGKAGTKAGYKCVCKSGFGGQFCDRKSKLKLLLLLSDINFLSRRTSKIC